MSSNTREDGGTIDIYKAGLIAISILFGRKERLEARYTNFSYIMASISRFSYFIMLLC